MSAQKFFTGRRKSAVARVSLSAGKGQIKSNWEALDKDKAALAYIQGPLKLIDKEGKYNINVIVSGGGIQGRLGAIRLGIARALVGEDPELKHSLRQANYLTRDPREKERKKPGLRGARRAPQWAKR